jgi:hypothetical protein
MNILTRHDAGKSAFLCAIILLALFVWPLGALADDFTVTVTSNGASPDPVAVGDTVNVPFSASSGQPQTTQEIHIKDGPHYAWTYTLYEGDQSHSSDSTTSSMTVTNAYGSPGYTTVTGTCLVTHTMTDDSTCTGSDSDTAQVTTVGVEKLQYENGDAGYVDVSGTIYVVKDTGVHFKAIKTPPDASWPAGKPIWTGASGSGETGTLAASTPSADLNSPTNVKADCGTTSATANVIICELIPKKTPYEPFLGRSYERFGVSESIGLDFETDPAGVTAAQLGGLRWTQYLPPGGNGTLTPSPNFDGTAIYDCPDRVDNAGGTNVTLKLEVMSGPSNEKSTTCPFSVVRPTAALFYKVEEYHVYGSASTGFSANVYARPSDVSFAECLFAEDPPPAAQTWPAGASLAIKNDWMAVKFPNDDYHQPGAPALFGQGDATSGCHVMLDEIQAVAGHFQPPPPWADGDGAFNIRYCYKSPAATDWNEFQVVQQRWTIDANGRMTMSKGGEDSAHAVTDLSQP